MKKIKLFYGLFTILFLVLGMCIYLLFRDMNNMFFFTWFPKMEFTKTIFIQLGQSIISYVVKYNLPDMLWFLSGILLLRFIWFFNIDVQKGYAEVSGTMSVNYDYSLRSQFVISISPLKQ